ncbi:MAG: hypothetical protein RJP95_02835 [Pirellulales bacterium]
MRSAQIGPADEVKLPEFALTVTAMIQIAQLTLDPQLESQFRYGRNE